MDARPWILPTSAAREDHTMTQRDHVHEAFRVSFAALAESVMTFAAGVSLLVAAVGAWIAMALDPR